MGKPRANRHMAARRLAVALRHELGSGDVPHVVATGTGSLADRILAIAEEHGVPVHQDPVLAGALQDVGVGQAIPEELFLAVAKVLAFLYRVDARVRN